MRSRLGAALVALGVLMVCAAAALFVANQQESEAAGSASAYALVQVVDAIGGAGGAGVQEAPGAGEASDGDAGGDEAAVVPDPYDPQMTVVQIDGYGYIGCLYVPALGLELPVISESSTQALYVAPCRYVGSTKTDDLVIAAHNYTRHFGKLSQLGMGSEVVFVDMDGVVSNYEVVDMQILGPYDVEEMTSGEYDLTLFTCTYGGANRVTVRCDRV